MLLVRIIPARAGFTLYDAFYRESYWDHPRSRGVYTANVLSGNRATGSSPLARGLLRMWENINGEWRIIPARAGFT